MESVFSVCRNLHTDSWLSLPGGKFRRKAQKAGCNRARNERKRAMDRKIHRPLSEAGGEVRPDTELVGDVEHAQAALVARI
jgi:hypothetical protein